MTNFRTSHGAEVDFIVQVDQEIFAIECKATSSAPKFSQNGFKSFESVVNKPFRRIVAYLGDDKLVRDEVEILPWQDVLAVLKL